MIAHRLRCCCCPSQSPLFGGFHVGALPLYEAAVIKEELEIGEPEVDEEGEALGFDALVVQLFEFMLSLAGSGRYRPLITPCLDQMLYLSLGTIHAIGAFRCE